MECDRFIEKQDPQLLRGYRRANGGSDPLMVIQTILSHTRHNARRLEAWGY
jgi:hypothetical protein